MGQESSEQEQPVNEVGQQKKAGGLGCLGLMIATAVVVAVYERPRRGPATR